MVVFGHFVFNSLFTFLYVTCSFLDILQFLSISHLCIFRFTAHKRIKVDENIEIKITKKPPSRRKEVLLKI